MLQTYSWSPGPVCGPALPVPRKSRRRSRIVGHPVPGTAAAGHAPVLLGVPGLERGLQPRAILRRPRVVRRDVEAPGQLAGLCVVGRDEATRAEIGPAVADDHLAIGDARRAGDAVGRAMVGGVCRPYLAAAGGVQRNQAAVERADIDLVAPERDAAVHRLAARLPQPIVLHAGIERPQLAPARGVEREHPAPGRGDKEASVRHQRRRLDAGTDASSSACQGQPQLEDTLPRSIWRQRRIMLLAVGAAGGEPGARFVVGIGDAAVGDSPARRNRPAARPPRWRQGSWVRSSQARRPRCTRAGRASRLFYDDHCYYC